MMCGHFQDLSVISLAMQKKYLSYLALYKIDYNLFAIGFGKTIVEGEKSLRFCPKYPDILPQYYSIQSTIENTQNHFYALKMDSKKNLLENSSTFSKKQSIPFGAAASKASS